MFDDRDAEGSYAFAVLTVTEKEENVYFVSQKYANGRYFPKWIDPRTDLESFSVDHSTSVQTYRFLTKAIDSFFDWRWVMHPFVSVDDGQEGSMSL